ncbi:hypothetical protein BUALT_Bualt07G0002000 [Buddleja alternifolia]|uniref:DUF1308 domain-containing protein n=1 Tax=Buddleja alternifolia TaxID=168488 RepID=A0AAV6X633_9LAMI|nr:hypothetical protein BUALT_Bualt07G0002000 [Buddleja alternifolia]
MESDMEAERAKPSSSPEKKREDAKRRCSALVDRVQRLSIVKRSSMPSPMPTLIRLIHSELAFLHRPPTSHPPPPPLSSNIGHLEAVVHVLHQPFVTGVSRVCKPITLSPSHSIYVDVVCSMNGNPVWFIVSDRNPRYLSWDPTTSDKNKGGLKNKIQQLVDAARCSPVTFRPSSIVLFFSNGLHDDVYQKLRDEFGGVDLEMEQFSYEELELEDEWTDLVLGRSFPDACVVEIEVVAKESRVMEKNLPDSVRIEGLISCNKYDEYSDSNVSTSLCSLVSIMKCCWCSSDDNAELEGGVLKQSLGDAEAKLVNFDTTALVAIVSGISNGRTEKLLATPERELRGRFKGNYEFVIAQVDSENQNPIHSELVDLISGKRGIICESVYSEFQELISMCGGPNEKLRAKYFLKFLKLVPNCPSTRLMSLPTTRKLALKNKVVFGTGDYWHAPTVTANMAFVRAVSQTGMSLSVIEHRPRALIGRIGIISIADFSASMDKVAYLAFLSK